MTYRSLVAAWVLLLISPVKAQQGPAAHFFVYQVNSGAQAKFEEGYRHHLGWHRSHHDPLVWYGWTVSDGKHDGYFIDASVGEPFAAFDHRVQSGSYIGAINGMMAIISAVYFAISGVRFRKTLVVLG